MRRVRNSDRQSRTPRGVRAHDTVLGRDVALSLEGCHTAAEREFETAIRLNQGLFEPDDARFQALVRALER